MTEKEKMLNGMLYDPGDEELYALRVSAHKLSRRYNNLDEDDKQRKTVLNRLVPDNNGAYLQGPVQFDYGRFTKFGKGCYANFNFTVLDCAPVNIGDNVFIGSGVTIATPVHPLLPKERNMYQKENGEWTDREDAKPITIESDCWIASNVTICGGVTIGEGCVIGAGSVVTRDVPANSFAAGNPCKVIRKITEQDSVYLKKELFPKQ